MIEKILKKADYLIGLLPLLGVFVLLVIAANVEIKDLDLWLHLAMGKFITQSGYVPGFDMLSCTIAGNPWINHEWLFQIIVYNIYNSHGAAGLILMQVIVVSLTMLILFLIGYNKDRQLISTILLFLLFMVFHQRFTIRPDLYSLLFFSIYIFVLSLHIDKGWSLPVLFTVQIIWSNMHGFFFFGPLFVLIGIVSEFIKRNVPLPYEWNKSGRLTDSEYKRIKIIFLFVILACLFNPQFVLGAWYPVSVFFSLAGENKIFFDHIQELQKPVSPDTILSTNRFLYYKVLILFSAISFVFNRRRIDISALFFWLIFLLFSLQAIRNTPFFAFAAYLVIVTNLLQVNFNDIVPLRFSEKRFLYATTIVLNVLFFIWLFTFYQSVSMRSYYDFDQYELKSEYGGISQRSFPDKAVDFLVENNIKGRFFNDFNSGAYLLGRTFPNIKVFIDGRTEVYGGKYFEHYQKIWEKGDADLFEQAVEQFGITGAFLNSTRHHIPKKILKYLYAHEDWEVVYFNYDAVILLKNVDEHREIIDRYKIDLTKWSAPKADLLKLGALRVKPYQPYYRAYTLESLDLDDQALEELGEAIRIDPIYAEAQDLTGMIYAKKGDFEKAFEHFRVAVSMAPMNKEMRHNLALAYYDLGHYEESVRQYTKITHTWPQDPKGHFLKTKALIAAEQYEEALSALQSAHALRPQAVREILELGDLLMKKKAYVYAEKSFRVAQAAEPNNASVYKMLGHLAVDQGNLTEAKNEYEKALELAPEDESIKALLNELNKGASSSVPLP